VKEYEKARWRVSA
jgi:hypothetical protein